MTCGDGGDGHMEVVCDNDAHGEVACGDGSLAWERRWWSLLLLCSDETLLSSWAGAWRPAVMSHPPWRHCLEDHDFHGFCLGCLTSAVADYTPTIRPSCQGASALCGVLVDNGEVQLQQAC
jgi:hypothetical protein